MASICGCNALRTLTPLQNQGFNGHIGATRTLISETKNLLSKAGICSTSPQAAAELKKTSVYVYFSNIRCPIKDSCKYG